MDEIIETIARKAEISPDQARKATSVLLSYLDRAVPAARMAPLYAAVPGSQDLVEKPKGAFAVFNTGLMGAYASLSSAGLSTTQMQVAGTELLASARARAGNEAVDAVIEAVPMLRQLL